METKIAENETQNQNAFSCESKCFDEEAVLESNNEKTLICCELVDLGRV